MFKLFKYLKKSIWLIGLIVVLLFIQATCDLALPDYTSKIVNVGIQQSGIDNVSPVAISEKTYDKLMLFLNDEEKEYLFNYYDLKTINDYKNYKDYDLLKTENVYVLNTKNKDIKENISNILTKPFMISNMFNSNQEINLGFDIPNEDIYILFNSLSEDEVEVLLTKINSIINEMPDSVIKSSAIMAVKSEYELIGVDISNLQTSYIISSGTKMIIIAFVIMFISIVIGYFGSRLAASFGKVLREKVFEKVVSFSKTEMKKYGTSSLITRTTNDIQQIQHIILFLLRVVFYAPIMAIGGVLKTTSKSGSMGWIIFAAICTLFILLITLFSLVMPKFKILQTLVDKLNLVSREILNGIPVIRAFSNEKHEEKRFDEANKNLTKVTLFVNRLMSLMMPLMNLLMYVVGVAIVWNGSYLVDNGTMQVGDIMAYIQYSMQIIISFLMIGMMSIMLPRAAVSARRIVEILECDVSIKNTNKRKNMKKDIEGIVEFKNVCFRYPDALEDVITDVTFKSVPGTTTAFIGSTGSGKSTLINLIPRFYDASEGEVLIDGVNIKDIDIKTLRSKIGYVPQKGMLFSGDIESNIKYGDYISKIDDSTMLKASKIAQVDGFVNKFNDKYKHEISQGGTNVSGGQRQRISIARAVAIDPSIYVFDDSFSALDFKTDAKLRKELAKVTKNKTVFIVAQRISTILNADQIIVLDEGKVVGIGTHKDLMKNCEVYKEIALSQLSEEELSNV